MAADKVAALQSAGPAGAGADDDGAWVALGGAVEAEGVGEVLPGVVPCVCGWLGPQAVSNSTTVAAAVEITTLCEFP